MSSSPLQLKFIRSAVSARDLPEGPLEIAVVGRSNVGKSSLINAMANHKMLAHVSNTPGRTQLINQFALRLSGKDIGVLVDLPGYGFAKVPQKIRQGWQQMIEGYLLHRPELILVFVLVDGEIGPTPLDVQMLEWLKFNNVPITIVATKLDKVKATKRGDRKIDFCQKCGVEQDDVVWVSSTKGQGIDALRGRVIAAFTSSES